MTRFAWDETKNCKNQEKHGVSFATAALIFDDPGILSVLDERFVYDEERWISIGLAGTVILVVAHTEVEVEDGEEENVRIISARKATKAERERYGGDEPAKPR